MPLNDFNPTQRFSDRAHDYAQYRPSYPIKILTILEQKQILNADSIIADIGSGTGIWTTLLLSHGYQVYGIEPNQEMRTFAEQHLHHNKNFHSLKGQAENTTLPSSSVDIITVAQAFHWFEIDPTKHEFKRILRPQGWVILIWNTRDQTSSFGRAYDNILLEYCPKYHVSPHRDISKEQLFQFFGHSAFEYFALPFHQDFTFESFIGRVHSSSYSLSPTDSNYPRFYAALKELFHKYSISENNTKTIQFHYQTQVYYGQIH